MDITKLIKTNKELSELPFIAVFRTIEILKENGLLRSFEDVDRISQ